MSGDDDYISRRRRGEKKQNKTIFKRSDCATENDFATGARARDKAVGRTHGRSAAAVISAPAAAHDRPPPDGAVARTSLSPGRGPSRKIRFHVAVRTRRPRVGRAAGRRVGPRVFDATGPTDRTGRRSAARTVRPLRRVTGKTEHLTAADASNGRFFQIHMGHDERVATALCGDACALNLVTIQSGKTHLIPTKLTESDLKIINIYGLSASAV